MPTYIVTVRETRVFTHKVVTENPLEALNLTIDKVATHQLTPMRCSIDTANCDVRDVSYQPMKERSHEALAEVAGVITVKVGYGPSMKQDMLHVFRIDPTRPA